METTKFSQHFNFHFSFSFQLKESILFEDLLIANADIHRGF